MWQPADLEWLDAYYPGLKLADQSITGDLSFSMLRANGRFIVNPTKEQQNDKSPHDYLYITDTYRIKLQGGDEENYPTAYELGGRLAAVARHNNLQLCDMHQYENRALCLAAPMALAREFEAGFNMQRFIDTYVIPYFFAQSNYAKNKEWLIGDLHHGFIGLLQWLGRLDDYDDDDIQATYDTLKKYADWDTAKIFIERGTPGHFPCPCGSGKKIRECHPEVKTAVARIRGQKRSASVAI